MKAVTIAQLQRLLGAQKGPCVSLFMPTHRQPNGMEEDLIRFKNLVGEAERKLNTTVHPRAAKKLLKAFEPCLDREFWRGNLDSLALFASPDVDDHFRMPIEVQERVVVADTFHVRPLIRFLQTSHRYFVLVLSKKNVRFLEGTREGLELRQVPDLPASLEDALGPQQRERVLGYHTSGRGRMFHGQQPEEISGREDVARFLRRVDDALWSVLRDEQVPLIAMGVTRLLSAYRGVCRYHHLAPIGVEGSFDRATAQQLHERVWPIAEGILRAREDEAIAEYQRVNGAGLSSNDLELIAQAAVQGRVRRLLVQRGARVHGRLDRDTGGVLKRDARENGFGDDVLDDVAESVLVRGGEVLMLPKDRMPTRAPIAAVLRW